MKYEVLSTKDERGSATSVFVLRPWRRRAGFTLTELMIVIMIIGIMSALALSAISAAGEFAREQRTRAIIAKLDQLLMDKYESYRTRAVPLSATARRTALNDPNAPRAAALKRLEGIRELMRLEMPDRISDLCNPTQAADLYAAESDGSYCLGSPGFTNQAQVAVLTSIPSVTRAYKRQVQRAVTYEFTIRPAGTYFGWSIQHQGSECLYLILCQTLDGDKQAIDYFAPEEIGDTDNDGMKEILDGWGQPIEFIRWAPGYVTNPWDTNRASMATTQTRPALDPFTGSPVVYTPDIFDPAKVDTRVIPTDPVGIENDPFELRPLLISGGRDRQIGIILEDYQNNDPSSLIPRSPLLGPGNDPYAFLQAASLAANAPRRLGEPFLPSLSTAYADNLTNHFQETP